MVNHSVQLAAEWAHWHPVMLARSLGTKPHRVMILGVELVVFRTVSPGLAVLHDVCPHRRARLSEGVVEGDEIICPYHGFRYGPDGHGASPGTPRLRLQCLSFEVREAWDVIWVRRRTSLPVSQANSPTPSDFPELERPGFTHLGSLVHDVECGLEPLVDNFCEVEHTPTTHALFGYRHDALSEIDVQVETTDTTVRVLNLGPQKPIPGLVERLFGVYGGDTFVDDWTVYFSPVHIIYDQWWRDPKTAEPRGDRLHIGVFFTPIDADETRLFSIVFSDRKASSLPGVEALRSLAVLAIVDREVRLDRARVEALADKRPGLGGTRLGRFDAALREHRKRIATLYRQG